MNNLENDIKDLEDQNVRLEKDKTYKIDNLKSQINNLDTDIAELEAQRDNFQKQKKYQIATIQSQIIDLESQIKYTSEEIKILEFKKNNVHNIQILKPATISPDPIKPKKKLIVILATFIGIFMMVFLSFFLEYISKIKMQKASSIRVTPTDVLG